MVPEDKIQSSKQASKGLCLCSSLTPEEAKPMLLYELFSFVYDVNVYTETHSHLSLGET